MKEIYGLAKSYNLIRRLARNFQRSGTGQTLQERQPIPVDQKGSLPPSGNVTLDIAVQVTTTNPQCLNVTNRLREFNLAAVKRRMLR